MATWGSSLLKGGAFDQVYDPDGAAGNRSIHERQVDIRHCLSNPIGRLSLVAFEQNAAQLSKPRTASLGNSRSDRLKVSVVADKT
jgi:hypothetical protein